jgi:hypothetical protein
LELWREFLQLVVLLVNHLGGNEHDEDLEINGDHHHDFANAVTFPVNVVGPEESEERDKVRQDELLAEVHLRVV